MSSSFFETSPGDLSSSCFTVEDFRVKSLRFGVWGLGFGFWVLGFGFWGVC